MATKETKTFRFTKIVSRERYVILLMLTLSMFFLYLDRATLSIVAPALEKEFGIPHSVMGVLLSLYIWGITIFIFFSSTLMHKIGGRSVGGISLGGFSAVTLLTATSFNIFSLAFWRFLLGVFEAPAFPLCSFETRRWFPQTRRHLATAVYMIGSFLGLAVGVPFLGWIFGITGSWQAVFIVSGIAGMIFTIFWIWRVRDNPAKSRWSSQKEVSYIKASPDLAGTAKITKPTSKEWRQVLFGRRLIGMYLAGGWATSAVVFFLLTWFPIYLLNDLGLNFKSGGLLLSSLPFICVMLGMAFGGFLSDYLIKRGVRSGRARRSCVGVGLLGSALMVFTPLAGRNLPLVLVILCTSLFAAGMCDTAWLLASEIAKPELLGLTLGVYGFWVEFSGAITPIVIGFVLQISGGNFTPVFIYVGAWAIIGVIAYLFIVDDVAPAGEKTLPTKRLKA